MEVIDFWKQFESFNHSFKKSNRLEISDKLEDARSYVNGLTDGWHEFLSRLKVIQASFSSMLTSAEKDSLNKMILELEHNLKR